VRRRAGLEGDQGRRTGAAAAAPGRRADLAAMILSQVQIAIARSCGRPLAFDDMA
jgi:hypothetical protein